jgi:hypothetical protein
MGREPPPEDGVPERPRNRRPGRRRPTQPRQDDLEPENNAVQQGQALLDYPSPGQPVVPVKRGGVPTWVMVTLTAGLTILVACGFVIYIVVSLVNDIRTGVSRNLDEAFLKSGPSSEAAVFYAFMEEHSYYMALTRLSSGMYGQWDEGRLQEKWIAFEDGGTIVTEILDESNDQETGTVKVMLVSNKGKTYIIDLSFAVIRNEWIITGASPSLIPDP